MKACMLAPHISLRQAVNTYMPQSKTTSKGEHANNVQRTHALHNDTTFKDACSHTSPRHGHLRHPFSPACACLQCLYAFTTGAHATHNDPPPNNKKTPKTRAHCIDLSRRPTHFPPSTRHGTQFDSSKHAHLAQHALQNPFQRCMLTASP